jgi:nucleotide-binding universal stress UspA family protein
VRALFLPIYWDQSFAARLDVAITLANRLNGRLVCAVAEPVSAGAKDFGCVLTESARHGLRVTPDIRLSVEEHFRERPVEHSWLPVTTLDAVTLAQAAELSDLVIAPTRWSVSEPESPRPADLLVRSAAPLLAVPPEADLSTGPIRALVAWDGSAGAASALRAALPILRTADYVVLLTVGETPPHMAIDPLEYLSWHGIHGAIECVPRQGSVYETLLIEVEARNVNLLVMGAYGWGRVVEELFGGITESMLEHAKVSVLLNR